MYFYFTENEETKTMKTDTLITEINNAWNWVAVKAAEVIRINDFGNVIFIADTGEYWRLCPEELSCEKIAKDSDAYIYLSKDSDFIEDWKMEGLVQVAKQELGELNDNQKFCLKMPAVIGGQYELSNLGKISFSELIAFSGNMGSQIKDLKDGQKFKLEID